MPDLVTRIAGNVAEVRGRMAQAAQRAGRRPEDVTLVAVTKYVGPEEIRALVCAGCDVLGENRPQDLQTKSEALAGEPIHWHMIGTLQRNKVRRTLPLVDMVESADSPRLVEAIDRIAGELGLRMPILLEVNISGEATKHGFTPESVESFLTEWPGYPNVDVRGLMAMASWGGPPEDTRRQFARLRELRDRLTDRVAGEIDLRELSMGTSGDFELAIEQGATIVRVGSALYQGRGGR